MVMAPILATGTFEAGSKDFCSFQAEQPKAAGSSLLVQQGSLCFKRDSKSLGTVRLAAYKADEIFGPRCYSIVWADAFVHSRLESLLLVAQMHSR